MLLHFLDFFFYSAFGNQLIHKHGLILADTMGSVRSLFFRRWIPPRIIMDNGIGRGEIEPSTARFLS